MKLRLLRVRRGAFRARRILRDEYCNKSQRQNGSSGKKRASAGFEIAFRGGAVMGLLRGRFGIIGVTLVTSFSKARRF
jgi:hypothetical protein